MREKNVCDGLKDSHQILPPVEYDFFIKTSNSLERSGTMASSVNIVNGLRQMCQCLEDARRNWRKTICFPEKLFYLH